VSFAMPRKYKMREMPVPINKRLMIRQVGAKTMASLRWSGNLPDDDKMEHKRRKLLKYLEGSNYSSMGNINLFQYDSPFTPGWIRRNEALV